MFSSQGSQVNSSDAVNYIEDVFSTWLYTGNGSTQTITNGIDLAGKGGLVWTKGRSNADPAWIMDTTRGTSSTLVPSNANAAGSIATVITSFNSNGFTLGTNGNSNTNGNTYVGWTFRKQPNFFDVVTYTGDGSNPKAIAHNLGSTPGCIIIKRTDSTGDWWTYHRGLSSNNLYLKLNTTAASASSTALWGSGPTSTTFTVNAGALNTSGATYVAYLFARDAGGFGLTVTDNVISCGSFTTDGGGAATVNLGYEPQWLLVKTTAVTGQWFMVDNMRGMPVGGAAASLYANLANAESLGNTYSPFATGFNYVGTASEPFIYIAIRRGPMKVPTDGTSVFSPNISSGATGTAITTNFPVDMQIGKYRAGAAANAVADRLRGVSTTSTEVGSALTTTSTAAEGTASGSDSRAWDNTGFQMPANLGGLSDIFWNFRRAPSFFDEVCYTGTGVARTINHNLAAVPELMIVKNRTGADAWYVTGNAFAVTEDILLNSTAAKLTNASSRWNSTRPTASVFSVGTALQINDTGDNYVWYGFASAPGISKVGSYTGTGTTLQVNCGFTAGARFVLIKRTDSTGDWYVWDSARGIVAGNDPYLTLNSTAAEVTTTDYIDTYSAGFEISSTAPAAINASGGTFIFLAIA